MLLRSGKNLTLRAWSEAMRSIRAGSSKSAAGALPALEIIGYLNVGQKEQKDDKC